jgi:hypothetical protein
MTGDESARSLMQLQKERGEQAILLSCMERHGSNETAAIDFWTFS